MASTSEAMDALLVDIAQPGNAMGARPGDVHRL